MVLINKFDPIFEMIGRDPDSRQFMEFKKSKSAEEFCLANKTSILIKALSECYETEYDAEPPYTKIDFLLKKILLENNILPGGRFSTTRVVQNN